MLCISDSKHVQARQQQHFTR